jgi:hypothetical protein
MLQRVILQDLELPVISRKSYEKKHQFDILWGALGYFDEMEKCKDGAHI